MEGGAESNRSVAAARRLCPRESPIHFLLGWIGDFVNKPKLTAICMFLGVISVLPMQWTSSLWALWFFTCLYSVLDASIPVFLGGGGDFFGRRSFGTIRGNMNLFYTWGSILGPFIAGAVYDCTQSYQLVFAGINGRVAQLHAPDGAPDTNRGANLEAPVAMPVALIQAPLSGRSITEASHALENRDTEPRLT
jgi:MFS family permease